MRILKFIILIVIIQLSTLPSINAEIKLPAIVSSNMVLQRDTNIQIWGWADFYEEITIETSWLTNPIKIKADKYGNWKIEIKTTNSKKAQSITLKSKTSNIILDNILFGEVWLCSGQSNMQQPIKGYNGQPTFGSKEAIINSKNPNLRLFTVDRLASKTPLKQLSKFTAWQEASSDNVADFSAVAYFFGQQLQQFLDVPVGLIHTSWGGSKIEAWMSLESLNNYQTIDTTFIDLKDKPNQQPTLLFNAMIHPIIPYTIKGALWYQGESNRHEPEQYKKLFASMVKDWRTRWDIGDFPFYFAQIAPFKYIKDTTSKNYVNTAFFREAQLQCLELVSNTGIAVTIDVGDENSIHPPKKKEVADRLLYNALNQTYGYINIDFKAPVYESFEIENNTITVTFNNIKMGLYSFDELTEFEIAGADKVFYPAKAIIIKNKNVSVSSEKVLKPVAVRYAWKNYVKGTLLGTNLLPVASFRTDNWEK